MFDDTVPRSIYTETLRGPMEVPTKAGPHSTAARRITRDRVQQTALYFLRLAYAYGFLLSCLHIIVFIYRHLLGCICSKRALDIYHMLSNLHCDSGTFSLFSIIFILLVSSSASFSLMDLHVSLLTKLVRGRHKTFYYSSYIT